MLKAKKILRMNKSIFEYLKTRKKPWKFLAPMVGNSDFGYRKLAYKYGADLCYTEMVQCSAFNNIRNINPVNNSWFYTDGSDRPLVVQIAGNNPEVMAKTAKHIEHVCDAIDINFGCPQEVARKGTYGAYLMDNIVRCGQIVRKVSESVNIPVFCKIRVFEDSRKTLELAHALENNGCSLLAVHGRTRDQRGVNTGLASWEQIRIVKNSLKIPVIANGNMPFHDDIEKCINATGCDGVMIAEPHLYNPAIFTRKAVQSVEMLEEYIGIIKSHGLKGQTKYIRSHAFKIMGSLVTASKEFAIELGNCNSLENYENLIARLKKNDSFAGITLTDELFEMKPKIRNL